MGLKINPDTKEISIDFSQIVKAGSEASKLFRFIVGKVKNAREEKTIKNFLRYRNILVSERKFAAMLAAFYYKSRGSEVLRESVPILLKKDWIPSIPVDLTEIKLELSSHKEFKFEDSIYAKQKILPLGEKKYSSVQGKFIDGIVLYQAPAYRLIEVKKVSGNYVFKFGMDTYYNYIDTCELVGFELCREILRSAEGDHKFFAEFIKGETSLALRSQIDPFDFNNRSAVVGINTVLILINQNRSSFYVHRRSNVKLAEAINTIHVVPAGTFQPRHIGLRKEDFSFYCNIMREFGEELLGHDEFIRMVQDDSNIFDVNVLKQYDLLVKRSLGRAYYLGMGLDCLTAKPEILTALVFDKEAVDVFLRGCKFKDNFEGEHAAAEFSEEALGMYIKDNKMLPAGAACLYLVKKNFEFFKNCLY